jgi:hypothetical protein
MGGGSESLLVGRGNCELFTEEPGRAVGGGPEEGVKGGRLVNALLVNQLGTGRPASGRANMCVTELY